MMQHKYFYILFFCTLGVIHADYPSAKDSFKSLNKDTKNPFVLSFGMSQVQADFQSLQNTPNPEFILTKLQQMAQKQANPRDWLSSKDRIWYILRSLPKVQCTQCKIIIDPPQLDLEKDSCLIERILDNLAFNRYASKLAMTQCPCCQSFDTLVVLPKNYIQLTESNRRAMIKQINALGINNQAACQNRSLPNYRFSPDMSSILKDDVAEIDPIKLARLSQFLKDLGNPLVFLHNYANPLVIANLFERSQDIAWFANYCAQVIRACPNITHVCPIVQPVAFAFRVGKLHNLPPFEIGINLDTYFKNMTLANIAACKKIKEINPKIKTLISHQWKIFKPRHSLLDPRGVFETMVCKIANQMYNEKFVQLYKRYSKYFDGISLSLYPPVYFDLWTPQGDNLSGEIDQDAALQAILSIHQAFPDKDIYVGETSCNTFDPAKQKEFIDMTLHVCKLARDQGVPIKGVYFWSHANKFYSEWNKPANSTNLAPFEDLDEHEPLASMNAAGRYLYEILH